MKRMAMRGLAVALVGATVLAGTAVPAQAFNLDESTCDGTLSDGERDMVYMSDDNKTTLGLGYWQWDYRSSKPVYWLWVIDPVYDDDASMAAEVVTTAGGTITYQHESDYKITYGVKKYRFVWNGYATSWFDPVSCGYPLP